MAGALDADATCGDAVPLRCLRALPPAHLASGELASPPANRDLPDARQAVQPRQAAARPAPPRVLPGPQVPAERIGSSLARCDEGANLLGSLDGGFDLNQASTTGWAALVLSNVASAVRRPSRPWYMLARS